MISILTMLPMVFADSIKDDIKNFEYAIESHDQTYLDRDKFKQDLKIESWDLWLQEGPKNNSFCIHLIHVENPSYFIASFKKAILQKNSYALFLDSLFRKHLSSSYSLINPSLTTEKVLDLDIDPNCISVSHDFCYVLPLLPDQIENHKKYCHLAMNEKKEQTIAVCKSFKMIFMKKWIQDSRYVVYYQKMRGAPDEARSSFLALKDNPKALLGTQTLREQTGLAFKDLCPKVRCISLFSN